MRCRNRRPSQNAFARPTRNVSLRALKRRPQNPQRQPAARSSAGTPPAASPRPLSRSRLWLFRGLALTLAPLLLLGTAELGLRLAGYGYATAFFKPTVINGEGCRVENDKFGRRFFPAELARSPAPTVMRTPKPPGRYRIFLLGESAALGDPAPAFGVGRYLQALLRERFPTGDFEVVCVAMTAINSHALRPMARECARYEGDLWLIYMGNNEMVGPFGAATVFGAQAPPVWLVRLRLALGQTRLMQALTELSERWRGAGRARTWEGMKLFMEHQLAPDDPARETVYRNFRANLEAMLRAGERAGVPVVLSTVAVNLKDFAPLASRPGLASGTNLPPDFAGLMAAAAQAQAAGDWPAARRAYEMAAASAPRHAEVQFRLGQCQLALSNPAAALANFSQARDDDALPFRTDSRLNTIIAETGRAHAGHGVRLFDAEAELGAHSAAGIPGDESFYEHVHFNFDGNYRLARALAETIAGQLPALLTQPTAPEWATQTQCERRLGLTDWNRRDVWADVARRLQQPPFAQQPGNAARLSQCRARLSAIRQELTVSNAIAAHALYREAIQRSPDDFRLHWNFAEFLEATRDLPRATEEWRAVQARLPHHHVGHYQVGRLLAEQGQRAEARQWLDRAVELRPDLAPGWLELGRLSLAEGRHEESLGHLARASQLLPQDPNIPLQMAKTFSQMKRPEEAMQQARAALRLDPNFWEAHSFLGEELAVAGQTSEAQKQFEAALKLNPNHARTHLNLGVAWFKQGQREAAVREFEAALRLDPQLQPARNYLEQLKSRPPTEGPLSKP
jgi:tetratricopeptide (TPR) repeat protein